jgi:hypothetical protein
VKKTILGLCMVALGLLAPAAFAQTTAQDQTNASPSKSATKAEKDAARKARQAEGKKVAAEGQVSDKPESSGKVTGTTSADRKKTNAARRAKNAGVAKEPKFDKSPN